MHEKFGVEVSTDNAAAVRSADIVLIGVKPFQVPGLLREIGPALKAGALVISFAASVTTSAMRESLSVAMQTTVIRAMPNTPCALGVGITALSAGAGVSPEQIAMATEMFSTIGRTVTVDEKHMDAVTGLSASGPAFVYIILESLAEGGVKVGLPRDIATLLAAQTVLGAAQMVLETGKHPALLKDEVTTPAGCTIDGILELEEGGLRVTLIKAVMKAASRARELAAG